MAYEIASRIVSGRKVVSSAGTAEKLVADKTGCFAGLITAEQSNSAPIVVGDSSIIAAAGSQRGVVLTPGNPPVMFSVRDVSTIYVNSQQNGDAACFVYFAT
jgi:hypothetical protein